MLQVPAIVQASASSGHVTGVWGVQTPRLQTDGFVQRFVSFGHTIGMN
jgi:hypothetical protein